MRSLVLLALVAVGLVVAGRTASADPSCTIPPPVAHRGGTERHTENSLDAYREAGRAGVLTWETDVRFDRRGVPILMHDATLDRTTTGSGPVARLDVATTRVRLRDGQRIPTFRATRRSRIVDTSCTWRTCAGRTRSSSSRPSRPARSSVP